MSEPKPLSTGATRGVAARAKKACFWCLVCFVLAYAKAFYAGEIFSAHVLQEEELFPAAAVNLNAIADTEGLTKAFSKGFARLGMKEGQVVQVFFDHLSSAIEQEVTYVEISVRVFAGIARAKPKGTGKNFYSRVIAQGISRQPAAGGESLVYFEMSVLATGQT